MKKVNYNSIIFLLLISFIYTQSNENKTCSLFEECKGCIFCGNSTNDYSKCNFDNIFCYHRDKNNYEYNTLIKEKYSTFFRNDNEINLFCGNKEISLNKITDSFQILETKFSNNILSKSLHCDYIINNNFYLNNEEDTATLNLEIKNLNSDNNNINQNNQIKFTLFVIYRTENSIRFLNLTDNGIRNIQYNKVLDKTLSLDLLIDFKNDINTPTIEESLIISIITKNQSPKTRIIYIIIVSICGFLILLIIVLIILYVYIKKKLENDFIQRREQERILNEEKLKKTKELIDKLLKGDLKPIKFDQSINVNDCNLCSICYDNFIIGESEVSITPCNHIFHFACIKHWLETNIENSNLKCPNCNQEFENKIENKILELNHRSSQYSENINIRIIRNNQRIENGGTPINSNNNNNN